VAALTPDGPRVLVCPTSHLDWDWLDTFAEYFVIGPQTYITWGYAGAVNVILKGVFDLLTAGPSSTGLVFCYSLAETAYLQAFLAANPDRLALLTSKSIDPARFELMGGGLTSPDNLVCHGEVFIRNYLLGRRWLQSLGLQDFVAPVAWLPDDFGHDPQLPVVLAAMGLPLLGLSRVPGCPTPFVTAPIKGGSSIATQLNSEGVVFPWVAGDGSEVLTHYMPSSYGTVWDGSKTGDLQKFVETYATGWPATDGGSQWFATAGGDWAYSQWDADSWLTYVADYNSSRKDTDPPADIGTFSQYMNQVAVAPGQVRSPLLAQNFWTGFFASRPRLKALHYRAAQRAMAAEAAAALLRMSSTYATALLDDLDAAIDQAWQTLVPSSHHDYITGTAPDRVYWSEQLPQLELADSQAGQCVTRAVDLIAAAVTPASGPGQPTSVVVFNPLGFERVDGVVHLPAQDIPDDFVTSTAGLPVQRAADGGLLFRVPSAGSFGYTTVTLQAAPEPALPAPSDTVTLDNHLIAATLDRSQGWAITSCTVGGVELLPDGLGNSIRLYDDDGNLYQFGNELLQSNTFGNFSDTRTVLTGDAGEWLEAGPVRWHFCATVTGTRGTYTLDYLLYAGESVLRMRLTGAAPSATSVLTAFDLAPPADESLGYGLTYGTAHHYDDNPPVPYWNGPTFRATHDFAQVTGSTGPELAIYHQAVPAWSPLWADGKGQLLGALLRNTNGTDRGAAGTDPGVHTLEYALGLASDAPVTTGDALRTALAVTNPLIPAVAGVNRPTQGVSLPPQASLVTIAGPAQAILRVARTHPGSSVVDNPDLTGYYVERCSYIVRVYLPDAFRSVVTIQVPDLPAPGIPGYDPDLTAALVTALDEPVTGGPSLHASGDTFQFTPELALTTLQLSATRWPTLPNTGH